MSNNPGSSGKNTQAQSTGRPGEELDLRDLSVLRSQFSLTDNVDNKWQGEEHVPEEPIAFAPNRFFRQARSTSGKLAYVVFGITADCGVYYNWPAARQYLSKFRPYEKPDNRGYESYLEADEAWSFYKETGVVPLAPLDGSVAASISDRDRSATAHPSSPHHTPQADRTHPASRTGIPAIFYIVHEGYSPGVYNSLRLAENAISASDSLPILEAASRAEANQMFVDAFMTGRVVCTADDE